MLEERSKVARENKRYYQFIIRSTHVRSSSIPNSNEILALKRTLINFFIYFFFFLGLGRTVNNLVS